ncbi:MAG TPA: acetylglutamate kinase [Clostridiales bacterium]|nr:acetylglutamate kinase [Clostridiales bacterium]
MNGIIQKASILIEALPYIQRLSGKRVVIKYGGNAMISENIKETIMQDITLLKYIGINPIVVHGGGPEINKTLEKLNIQPKFHQGLRITDMETMDVVQMVLVGKINQDIVSDINRLGGKAVGITGKDASLIQVEKIQPKDGVDLGYVGQIKRVDCKLLDVLSKDEYIPVISPIGVGPDGKSYNINADIVAGEIAASLHAEKLVLLTDVDGIRREMDKPETLISTITQEEVYHLINKGIINGGMIPKVKGCLRALSMGVKRTHILNGTIPHAIILEIFTDKGIGTMVEK